MKIAFLGAGQMSRAILFKTHNLWGKKNIQVYSPSGESSKKLASEFGISWARQRAEVWADADYVVIACKPQQFDQLATQWKDYFSAKTFFISFCAALSLKNQSAKLHPQMIRLIPSLPCTYGEGILLIHTLPQFQEQHQKILEKLFSVTGKLYWFDKEDQLDQAVILAASGPGLLYQLMHWLESSFKDLPATLRSNLGRDLLIGSATHAKEQNEPWIDLVERVTSKGGVTRAVINEWEAADCEKIITKGIEAGLKRTEEIKKLLN